MALTLAVGLTQLMGCVAAQGNKEISNPAKISQLHLGVSTKDDARKLFGPPTRTELRDSGSVVWDYEYARIQQRATNYLPLVGDIAGGVDKQTSTLSLLFDQGGVLRNMDGGSSTGGAGGIQDLGK
jgi:outer membrane protein assembly factor BamE (lipoprotein component of BamABCDE complex)